MRITQDNKIPAFKLQTISEHDARRTIPHRLIMQEGKLFDSDEKYINEKKLVHTVEFSRRNSFGFHIGIKTMNIFAEDNSKEVPSQTAIH